MDLEQSVKDLQAQNAEFQALILNLSKGQEELKTMLSKNKKKGKKTQLKNLRPILQLRDAEASEDSDGDEQDDDASIKTEAKSNHDSTKPSEEEEDYYHEDEHPDDKYKLLEERMKAMEIQKIPGLDFEELGLISGVVIPPKFKTPTFV